MMTAKSGAAMAAAFGVILILALPGCGSSDDNAPVRASPPGDEQGNTDKEQPIPDVAAGSWGLNAALNGSPVQYGDATVRAHGPVNWVNASKSSVENVGDFRLKLPGDSSRKIPLMKPGNYACADTVEAAVTIADDNSYSTTNAKGAGTANPCTVTVDVSDDKLLKGTINDVTMVNGAGQSVTFSARFTAQVQREPKSSRPPSAKEE